MRSDLFGCVCGKWAEECQDLTFTSIQVGSWKVVAGAWSFTVRVRRVVRNRVKGGSMHRVEADPRTAGQLGKLYWVLFDGEERRGAANTGQPVVSLERAVAQ